MLAPRSSQLASRAAVLPALCSAAWQPSPVNQQVCVTALVRSHSHSHLLRLAPVTMLSWGWQRECVCVLTQQQTAG